MGSDNRAGVAVAATKLLNDISSFCAVIIFCGLPINVAVDPVLTAKQNASKKGTGFNPRARVTDTRSGVIATATTSFVSKDDRTAPTAISTTHNKGGDRGKPATRDAAQA